MQSRIQKAKRGKQTGQVRGKRAFRIILFIVYYTMD